MIIKSSQRAGHKSLAAHLSKQRDEDGSPQTVTIIGCRNLLSASTVEAALDDMEIMSWASPKTQKDLYHVSMSPSEELTPDQWEEAWQRYDAEFGLGNYPYVEVQHEKLGRCHRHRVYERVDTETQRAIRLSFTKIRNEKVCRELEYVFGHSLVIGAHNKAVMTQLTKQGKDDVVAWMAQGQAHTVARPIAAEQFGEIQQDRRSRGRNTNGHEGQRRRGSDGAMTKAAVKSVLLEAYANTDNGNDFSGVIAQHGLTLVREYRDRSGRGKMETFVVIDAGGERHSPRRLLGVKVATLRQQWRDYEGATPVVHDQLQRVGQLDLGQTKPVPQYIDYGAIDKADQERRQLSPPAVPPLLTRQQLRVLLMEAYAASDSGKAFEAAMATHNLLLCRSERRQALYVVDAEGNAYNTTRLIGVKTAEAKQRWADLDPTMLLTTAQAQQLRELQWARVLEDNQAQEIEAVRQEMSAADRLLEQRLIDDISALQAHLYQELAGEGPGAALYASTSPITLLNSDSTIDDGAAASTAAAWAEQFSGLGMNLETMVPLYGDEKETDQFNDGSTYGYRNLQDWQGQTKNGTGMPPSLAPIEHDVRGLITQQSHWQTIAGEDAAPERRPPQGKAASGGIGMKETGNTDRASSLAHDQQVSAGDNDIASWGLDNATLTMLQTTVGEQAVVERENRLRTALSFIAGEDTAQRVKDLREEIEATAGDDAVGVSYPDAVRSQEKQHQKVEVSRSAASVYLQALRHRLQQRGRNAYNQADRWLAERLAKRGFSRAETRRVLAQYSPALMRQAPSKRVGYIRRLTDRVYRRQEYWRPKVIPTADVKKAYGQVVQRYGRGGNTGNEHQQGTPLSKPSRRPNWRHQDDARDGRET